MKTRHAAFSLTEKHGPLQFYSTSELMRLAPPEWLVKGILPMGGFIGLYGESYTGKSFAALDLALCVASGIPWHGHPVKKGFVMYIAAEGGHGVRKRVQAWANVNGINVFTPEVGWLLQSIPVQATSEEVDIICKRTKEEIHEQPVLIIIDTLARCFAGDENTQEDMGQFVAGMDRFRTEFGAAVMAIHHTRVDNERERGSTAFRGAADTMILTTKPAPGQMLLKCTKQKDFEEFEPIYLDFKKSKGEIPELDSAALVSVSVGAKDRIIKAIQSAIGPIGPKDLTSVLNMPRSTLMETLRACVENGEIIREKGQYRLGVYDGK